MTSSSRIPPILAAFIGALRQDSLVLLTHTLSTNTNWLVIRYLICLFGKHPLSSPNTQASERDSDDRQDGDELGVVLVSWLRDYEFWRVETRRAGGVDLNAPAQRKKFSFVNALTASTPLSAAPPSSSKVNVSLRPVTSINKTNLMHSPPATAARSQATSIGPPTMFTDPLRTTNLFQTKNAIEKALGSLTSSALLILDAPDLLLAMQDAAIANPYMALHSLILSLRLHPQVYATIITLSSEIPGLNSQTYEHSTSIINSGTNMCLEVGCSTFVLSLSHGSDQIIGVRGLDTGAAGDVSGVIRNSVGGLGLERTGKKEWKTQECLYYVKGDGSATVWERGTASDIA